MSAQNHNDDGLHSPPPLISIQRFLILYDVSTSPPTSMSSILFKHVHCVIADLSISVAPVKRLFIILQFGRVQIFSLGHSLKQTTYYCWRAVATVLLGPVEAIKATLPLPGSGRGLSIHRTCMKRSKSQFPTVERS